MQAAAMSVAEILVERDQWVEPKLAVPGPQFHVVHEPPRWGPATRIAFRFVFSYLALYWLGMFVGYWLSKPMSWVSIHVLRLGHVVTAVMTGSGDSVYEYVLNFCILMIGIGATVIWSLLDRKRPNYARLQEWFRSLLRMAVGAMLIAYGAVKVIQVQMPPLTPSTLMETYGQSTPMHLLWTFMGASKAYNVFAGGVEMLAGMLLLIPGLTAIGSLVAVGAMANVFMLNMCYDVPVKLFSFHLLFMAAVLAAPDARAMVDFFVYGRRAELHHRQPLLKRKWAKRSLVVVHVLFGGLVVGGSLFIAYQTKKFYADYAKTPLYGVWSVEEYTVDGSVLPASSPSRWQRLALDIPTVLVAEANGDQQRFSLKDDPAKHTLNLSQRNNPLRKGDFAYRQAQPNLLNMSGQMDGHHIDIRLRRVELPKSLPLTNRGFHWTNEYPYNH